MINQYRPEIDSLRAIAVLGVIFFHLEFLKITGGFLGVDIFFVISGFLISNFVIGRINQKQFSFCEFYIKRVKRLFPALFTVCVTTLIFGFFKYQPDSLQFLSLTISSILLFLSNILFFYEATYFNDLANQSPLLHTWSLSVEEQFYLFFPLLTFFIFKKFSKNSFLIFVIFSIFISLVISQINSQNLNKGYFFLIQSRIFELAIGSLCSYLMIFEKKRLNNFYEKCTLFFKFIPIFSIVVILISFLIFNKNSTLPGFFSLIPVVATAIFILTIEKNNFLLKIFSSLSLVGIGKISYSLYLWHFPILIFFPQFCEPKNIFLYFIILFSISFCSWKFIEQPFRKKEFNVKKLSVYFLILNLLMLFVCSFIYISKGLKSLYINDLNLQENTLFKAVNEAKNNKDLFFNDECKFLEKNTTKKFINKVNNCLKKYPKFILVLGDSHAIDVFNAISYSSKYPFIIGLAQGNCRPHTPDNLRKKRRCHFQNAINFTYYYQNNIKTIVYSQKGSYLLTNYKDLPIIKKNAIHTKKYLEILNTNNNYPIIWLGPNPEPNIDFKVDIKIIQEILLNKKRLKKLENLNIYKVDTFLKKFLNKSKIIYLSKIDLLSFNITNDFYLNEKFTYSDTDHWSAYGEKIFGKRMFSNSTILKKLN